MNYLSPGGVAVRIELIFNPKSALTTRTGSGFVHLQCHELVIEGARRDVLREVPNFSLKEFKMPRKRPRRGMTPPASASEKTGDSSAPAPPQQSEGLYELNPLMTRMINAELQDVMIKVWQALPDEPDTDAERLVAEKFRNEGGDDFRDVLGLNVAQRLLQIFNKLTLRIQFSSPPQSTSLRSFLRRYSFVSFKRVEGTSRTFIAQVKYIADFDTLCSTKDLRCGLAKVVITPLYKFNQCPEKLKPTSFDKSRPKTDIKDISAKEPQKVEKDANVIKLPQKNEDTKVNQAKSGTQAKPSALNTPAKTNTSVNSAQTTPKPQSATQAKPQATPTQAKPNTTQAKTQATPMQVKANTTPAKPQATLTQAKANTTQAKPQATPTQVKANITQAKSQATPAQAKPQATQTQAKVNTTQAKPQATPAQAKANTTQAKPQATPTEAKANTTQAKPNTQATPTQAKNAKFTPTQAKPNTQATSQSKLNTPVVSQPKPNTSATSQAKPNTTAATKAKANVPATPAKPQQAKSATPTQAKNTPAAKIQTKPTQSKQAPKTQAKLAQAKSTPATPSTQTKQAKTNQAKIKISPQSKSARKSFEEKGDFDELDDHDILALMSGGIVLDECIGSDEE